MAGQSPPMDWTQQMLLMAMQAQAREVPPAQVAMMQMMQAQAQGVPATMMPAAYSVPTSQASRNYAAEVAAEQQRQQMHRQMAMQQQIDQQYQQAHHHQQAQPLQARVSPIAFTPAMVVNAPPAQQQSPPPQAAQPEEEDSIPDLPPLQTNLVSPLGAHAHKCDYHRFTARQKCTIDCAGRHANFAAAMKRAGYTDPEMIQNYIRLGVREEYAKMQAEGIVPPKPKVKRVKKMDSSDEESLSGGSSDESDFSGRRPQRKTKKPSGAYEVPTSPSQYGSTFVGGTDETAEEDDGAAGELEIMQLPERAEGEARDPITGEAPDNPYDAPESNKKTWPDPDPALVPAVADAAAKQCDRCGKWRYVLPTGALASEFCIPTGGINADALAKEQQRLDQHNVVAAAAAAAAAATVQVKQEMPEPGLAFDPARAAKLMLIGVANKFAKVEHSSDEEEHDDDAMDENTRAAKRRRKFLQASRKRIDRLLASETDTTETAAAVPTFPRAVIVWECSMNPDPSFNTCAHLQETVQPTHTVLKHQTYRAQAPWNFSMLGLEEITDQKYAQLYADPTGKWNKFETLTLLECIKSHGLEESVWKEVVVTNPLLRLRHAAVDDCLVRFLEILALASTYGQSLTSPFAARRKQLALEAWQREQQALLQPHLHGLGVPLAQLPHESSAERFNRLTGSTQAFSRTQGGGAAGKKVAPANTVDRTGARGRSGGTRLSSRLQTKKQTKYTYSSEDDDADFLLSEDSDAPAARAPKKPAQQKPHMPSASPPPTTAAATGGTATIDEEGEVQYLWKIEKILACRHRRVRQGHEESDDSEVEASIIDSTSNHHRHNRHFGHAATDEAKTNEPASAAAAASSRPTLSGKPTETNAAASTAMDTSDSSAAATTAAPSSADDVEMKASDAPAAAAATDFSASRPRADFVSSRRRAYHPGTASGAAGGASRAKWAHGQIASDDPDYTIITEYLIKYEGQSYLHVDWLTPEKMKQKFGPHTRIGQRLSNFHAQQAEMEATNLDRYGGEPFDPRYTEVDRVIASNTIDVEEEPEDKVKRESLNAELMTQFHAAQQARDAEIASLAQTDPQAAAKLRVQYMLNPLPLPVQHPTPPPVRTEMFFVKWQGLSYSQCTWETREDVNDEPKIAEYRRFNKPPSQGHDQRPPEYTQVEFEARRNRWYAESPTYKGGNQLRQYQVDGLNFLVKAWYDDRNTILADEMGLGKTVQCVALFEHLHRVEHISGPFLVVVPLSTVLHWKREFDNWTDFNTLVYHDAVRGKETRRLIRETEWYYPNTKQIKFHVMVTTYEVLIADIEELTTVPWVQCIIDEGHRLKSKSSKILEALQILNPNRRLLLTGTPVQNNMLEIFTLLNFIEPDIFASEEAFREHFGELSTSDQVQELQERIRPYMLRRMKESVEKSIPQKQETIVECEMTTIQKKYYRAIYERNLNFLRGPTGGANKAMPKLLNIEMELRKCCCHPWLVAGAEEKEIPPSASDLEYMQKTIEASGKMVLLSKLLPKLKAEGHRVLIFSQMINILDICQEFCEYMGYFFERLDGAIRGTEREAAIDRFTAPDSNRFIFLLSTRAGGVGLNLTSADTVIIFDSDWNPQQDLQAMARVHRIGQRKEVKIFRLITRDSYEASMFLRASKKLGLDHALLTNLEIGRGALDDSEKDDINKLLKLGAYGVFNDDNSAAQAFVEEDIDAILKNRTKVIDMAQAKTQEGEDDENGGSGNDGSGNGNRQQSSTALQSSRMNVNKMTFAAGDSGLDVNDPNFWHKLMPTADAERYTPSQLLSQLTDGSATKDDASKADFFKYLQATTERMLKAKRESGDDAAVGDMDALIGLLIQFAATGAFNIAQRSKADLWLADAERRVERKARASRVPTAALQLPMGRVRNQARQRGAMQVDRSKADAYSESDEETKPKKKPKLGRMTKSDSESENDSDDSFNGGSSAGSANSGDDEEADESRLDSDGKPMRRKPRARPTRSNKRRKGVLNLDICTVCNQSGKLQPCDGPCQGWYHLACAGLEAPPADDVEWKCRRCTEKRMPCAACHEEGPACEPGSEVQGGVNKCSIATCGRFYHIECIRKYPITYWYENSNRFRCALHYCAACAVPGDSQSMIHCFTCPIGLHIRCITGAEVRLAKKDMYCAACVEKVKNTVHGQLAIKAAETNNWEEPYREKKKPPPSKAQLKKKKRSGKTRGPGRPPKVKKEAAEVEEQDPFTTAAKVATQQKRLDRVYRPGEYHLRFKLDDEIVFRTEEKLRFFDQPVVPRIKSIEATSSAAASAATPAKKTRKKAAKSDDDDDEEASEPGTEGEDDDEGPPRAIPVKATSPSSAAGTQASSAPTAVVDNTPTVPVSAVVAAPVASPFTQAPIVDASVALAVPAIAAAVPVPVTVARTAAPAPTAPAPRGSKARTPVQIKMKSSTSASSDAPKKGPGAAAHVVEPVPGAGYAFAPKLPGTVFATPPTTTGAVTAMPMPPASMPVPMSSSTQQQPMDPAFLHMLQQQQAQAQAQAQAQMHQREESRKRSREETGIMLDPAQAQAQPQVYDAYAAAGGVPVGYMPPPPTMAMHPAYATAQQQYATHPQQPLYAPPPQFYAQPAMPHAYQQPPPHLIAGLPPQEMAHDPLAVHKKPRTE